MNKPLRTDIRATACPHDCPSTCALEVEVLDGRSIGRVRGAEDNLYTAGVICAKVARYAERIHHPDRLLHPLVRKGPKGSGRFAPVSWDDALDLTAEKFLAAEAKHGSEAVWPYYYAGTMGLVMRDGINRLRHVKKYSGFHSTICVNPSWTGYIAGTGKLACAVMHCLFRDGFADREFLETFTDAPRELEQHLRTRTPEWAAQITGCPVETIEAFAALIGERKRTYFRLGYGFGRSRNGAANMHAASCIPAITGAWLHEGGGAFFNNRASYHWDKTMIEGLDRRDPSIR